MNRFWLPLLLLVLAVGIFVGTRSWTEERNTQPTPPSPPTETEATAPRTEAPEPSSMLVASDRKRLPRVTAEAPKTDQAEGIPVLVITPDGAPVAGIEVQLRGRVAAMRNSEKRYAEATTNALGRAMLVEDAGAQAKRARVMKMMGIEFTFRVTAQVPLADPPSHELGEKLVVTKPVQLVLPVTGRIQVRVRTPDGEPLPKACQVFPFWRPIGSNKNYGRGAGAPREDVVNGTATLDTLPLGQEFKFNITGGKVYRSVQVRALGPTKAGELIEIDATLGQRMPQITGILVGEDGIPLTKVSVSMAIFAVDQNAPADAEPAQKRTLWTPLDENGRFTRITYLKPDPSKRGVVSIHEESRHTSSEIDRFARWDGTLDLRPGAVTDVGTLVLRPHGKRRLLASGRVRARNGMRLRAPSVDINYWNAKTKRWTALAEDRIKVDHEGRFEAYTIATNIPERFKVSAGARGHLRTSVEASVGDQGLDLILDQGGGLAGRFVTDEEHAAALLSVEIEGEDFRRSPNIAMGSFRVNNLPPGIYSVTAKAHGTTWRFGGIEGIIVHAGGFPDDPRLKRIDLRGTCRVLNLTLLAPDGKPISKQNIYITDSSGDGGSFRTNAKGEVFALVPATADVLDLRADLKGKRLGIHWAVSREYRGTVTLQEH